MPAFGPVSWSRVLLTLLLALAAAWLCVWLRTPIPWMIGPLLATSLVSVLGVPTESWTPLRNTGQWVIGTALGLYFTPTVGALVASLWWAIALGIAWALLLGLAFGAWLRRLHAGHLAHLTPAQLLSTTQGPVIAATDYVRAVPESVRAFVPEGRRYTTLGTDGFGRSDTRAALRRFFAVDADSIVQAASRALDA